VPPESPVEGADESPEPPHAAMAMETTKACATRGLEASLGRRAMGSIEPDDGDGRHDRGVSIR
jgi:hypothetical protein